MLIIDVETASYADLKKVGVTNYAKHNSTKVICLCWSDVVTGESGVWLPSSNDIPLKLKQLLTKGDKLIAAFNMGFESLVLEHVLGLVIPEHKLYDVAVQARACGAPNSLADTCRWLGLDKGKLDSGKSLINAYSKKGIVPQGTDLALMVSYCEQDVAVTKELHEALPELPQQVLRNYQALFVVNQEGLPVDVELVSECNAHIELLKRQANADIKELTNGQVASATSRKDRDIWLRSKDAHFGEKITFDKAARAELLATASLDDDVKAFIRLVNSATGANKYKTMLALVDEDLNTIPEPYVYMGASNTGRFSSRGMQVHNMRRDAFKSPEDAIARVYDTTATFDDCARLVRSTITHKAGISWCDWSSIENVVLPWLAGEEKRVANYHNGVDQYKLTAMAIFRCSSIDDVTDKQRQAGKIAELSLGFAGGAGALLGMAANYKVSWSERAAKNIVTSWRKANKWATTFWNDLEVAALKTVRSGKPHTVGRLRFELAGRFLRCVLPSGRAVHYLDPKAETRVTPWGSADLGVTFTPSNARPKAGAKQWGRGELNRLLLAENATQATAADFLMNSLEECELELDGALIGHTHDEIICLGDKRSELTRIMTTMPKWAGELQLRADAEYKPRYGK